MSQQWERSSPAPQKELSLVSHTDPQATTQHDQGTARPHPSARVRIGPESLPPSRREEIVSTKRNQVPRYPTETPSIRIDPPRPPRPRHDSYRMVDPEEAFRTPAAYSDRVRRDETLPPTVPLQQHDEISPRRPSTPTQDEYTEPKPAYPADHLETLIGILRAPELDLPVFKGDPMQYHDFMRAFDDNVESTE